MNDSQPPHPVEQSIQQLLAKTEDYIRREPTKAVGVAFGAGVLLKLLPTRAIVRPVATLAVSLLPSALLGLGLLKALELCNQKCALAPTPTPPAPVSAESP